MFRSEFADKSLVSHSWVGTLSKPLRSSEIPALVVVKSVIVMASGVVIVVVVVMIITVILTVEIVGVTYSVPIFSTKANYSLRQTAPDKAKIVCI